MLCFVSSRLAGSLAQSALGGRRRAGDDRTRAACAPHSKTWPHPSALSHARQRRGVRQSSAAFRSAHGLLLSLTLVLFLGGHTRLSAQRAPALVPSAVPGLRIQPGFQVSLYADTDLADDIRAIAIDPAGQVLVAGPGYIKTLQDSTGRGRADRFVLVATPAAGPQGLCPDGASLYASGNGWLSRLDDVAGRPASRPPFNLFPLGAGEAGSHAIHSGPDGALYVIGGRDSGISARLATGPSPVREVEGGALLRVGAVGRDIQIVCHGLHNARDFDFDIAGEVFSSDSGSSSDALLPWHAPARLLQLTSGSSQGWTSGGTGQGWARPDYYPDVAEAVAPLGGSAPTGLVCYRHGQFPARYRGGLFGLDWDSGRIFFTGLQPEGAGYRAQPELFLEAVPPHGFTPTGLAVDTNGSIFVSCGGRGTRGAVFRIDYAGPPLLDAVEQATLVPELNQVLQAPQPLAAWSRANWMPLARNLGPGPFLRVLGDESVLPVWRVRALEVVTELFGGLSPAQADQAARARSPMVRARVAWSLGRAPGPNPSLVLFPLLADPHPLPRRCALEAVSDHLEMMDSPELVGQLLSNLGFPDKRVRQAAARTASRLPPPSWHQFTNGLTSADPGSRLTGALARLWREPGGRHPELLEDLASILVQTREPVFRRDALCLAILAVGGWRSDRPVLALHSAYEGAALPPENDPVRTRLRTTVRAVFPCGDAAADAEAGRLLATMQDSDARVARVLMGLITPRSSLQADLHFLICFSRLRAWPEDLTPKVADALLGLNQKAALQPDRPGANWSLRLGELLEVLLKRQPRLAAALLGHPRFATPANLRLALQLGPEHRAAAARTYLEAVRGDPGFRWSPPLVELLSSLPQAEARPLLRTQAKHPLVRDDIMLELARHPEASDCERFWQGLASERMDVAAACVSALAELPREARGTNLSTSFGLLRRLVEEPKEKALRASLVDLVDSETGENFKIEEPAVPATPLLTHAAALRAAFDPAFAWLATHHPALFANLDWNKGSDPAKWAALLQAVPWAAGVAARGERLFFERGCAACHTGSAPFGPALGGVTTRLSAEELFSAIVRPWDQVVEPYRPDSFLMRDGTVVNGRVVHDAPDWVIVRTGPAVTARFPVADIVVRRPSRASPMPAGLLRGLPPQALADLYSFLKSMP